jgi:catechol 2,3-dioxygenase-like lactoylglutathione lyase family enzyme
MSDAERVRDEDMRPSWHGINHLALVTTDMDATVRFYHGTLGARLVATISTPEFRHYFFEFGPQCTVAFFEYADAPSQPFVNRAGVPNERAPQFDHLSLNLPDEHALNALRQRLQRHDWEVTDIIDHDVVRSVYFSDPNGIALEASWWVRDPTSQPPDHYDPQLFADPDPVSAVVELQNTGTLTGIRGGAPAPTG